LGIANKNEMYICKIIDGLNPFLSKLFRMKNKFLTLILLALVALAISSCYSSRKSGCPMNPQSSYRFRGWNKDQINCL